MNIHQRLAAIGAAIPEISLPGSHIDLRKWAVIACDQYTQDRNYWASVERTVGDAPSALNLIFPEVYLEDEGREERVRSIHQTMDRYSSTGVLAPPRQCAIYLERRTPFHTRRRGIVLAVDLEQYDWNPGARPLIRATEGTVPERLPPRMVIRRSASLEIPHILLLIDDEEDTLIPSLGEKARKNPPLYETDLMLDAGGVTGWALDTEADWTLLAQGLETLSRRAISRYGSAAPSPAREGTAPDSLQERPFLYAMGDGNHSLATAKAVWEEYKTNHPSVDLAANPARWALVELENLYDPGIAFEPIHRLLLGPTAQDMLELFSALPGFTHYPVEDRAQFSRLIGDPSAPKSRVGIITKTRLIVTESEVSGLVVSSLQPLLDTFIRQRNEASIDVRIDYIHGEDELFRLIDVPAFAPETEAALGLLLPPIRKGGLFQTVARSGPLPRKSFSMGEAKEKRFYLECRRLS